MAAGAGPDLGQVSARKNLNETAFFFPHLLADAEGRVKIEFTMPEALTEWKFLAFAHDRDLRSGLLEDKVVTAKDLMVQPNPPRFLREGDVLEFTVKVANQSATRQTGSVRLTLADARTGKPADPLLRQPRHGPGASTFPPRSRGVSPGGCRFPTRRASSWPTRRSARRAGSPTARKGFLPVLPRRILVTESLPLPIRGPATKKFDFTRLSQSGESKTLQNQTLTVQMVSQSRRGTR